MSQQLDVASTEAQEACKTALRWLNMKTNQIKPFTLKQINTASKEEDGKVNLNVILVTECFQGKDFNFELTLDPAVNSPVALVHHKQLN